MTVSVQQIGLFILASMVIVGIISYFLGVRKTHTPFKSAALGFVFAVIPVLGIIYVIYLSFKEDIEKV